MLYDRELNQSQNARQWVLHLSADEYQKLLRKRQEFVDASNRVQNINNVNEKINNSIGGENFDYHVGMAVLHRDTGKPAGNIFNFTVANLQMENELELMAPYIICEMVVISLFLKEFQKIDRWCRTSLMYGLFTSAESTHNALGSITTLFIFVRTKKV